MLTHAFRSAHANLLLISDHELFFSFSSPSVFHGVVLNVRMRVVCVFDCIFILSDKEIPHIPIRPYKIVLKSMSYAPPNSLEHFDFAQRSIFAFVKNDLNRFHHYDATSNCVHTVVAFGISTNRITISFI